MIAAPGTPSRAETSASTTVRTAILARDAGAALRVIEPGWSVAESSTAEGFLEAVSRGSACVAVIDRDHPGLDERELVGRLRRRERRGDGAVHVLLVSARREPGEVEAALELGDDFLPSPFDPRELRARIRAGWRQLQRRSELLDDMATLSHRAGTDPLTGLPNRRAAQEFAQREFDRWKRRGGGLCAIMADIDHFKLVNDRFGHRAGDLALVETARILSTGLRRYDLAARWGGEEFLLLCPHCEYDDALALAERLRSCLEHASNPGSDTPLRNLTASFGVAAVDSTRRDLDSLVEAADQALYQAKNGGRNRVAGSPPAPGSSFPDSASGCSAPN